MPVRINRTAALGASQGLTVFGVVVGEGGGIVRIGGIPAELPALGVVHGDGVL